MSEEDTPRVLGPLDVWKLFQDANTEIWLQGMTTLLKSDSFAQSMSTFLDGYLTSSAPLQKIVDYYMGLWLASVNMPSRDDVTRLERQLMEADSRSGNLDGKLAHMIQMVQHHIAEANRESGVSEITPHIQSLGTQAEQVAQALREQETALTQLSLGQSDAARTVQAQGTAIIAHLDQIASSLEERLVQVAEPVSAESSTLSDMQARMQALEARVEHVVQMLQAQAAQPPQAVQALEARVEHVVQMLQDQAAVPPPPPPTSDQSERIAEIETRLKSLDERTDQVLQAVQMLQSAILMAGSAANSPAPTSKARATPARSRKPPAKDTPPAAPLPEPPSPEPPEAGQ